MEKLAQTFGFQSISVDNHGETKDDLVVELRRQLIDQQDVFGFLFDGFPLDVHQALSFQEQIGCPDLVVLLCSSQRASIHRHMDMDMVSLRRYYQHLSLLTEVSPCPTVDADQDEDALFVVLSSLIKQKVFVNNLPP
ncbi:adenylate kinase isoenzyme 5-like [Gouania willdenowi]|uniref:adenylate kinase isoenzyme 5-like n=1 Tax=Gouania willdenowi TaxID=441366 RepID=UPI0010545950|nr:adenylate kinase isoenzyme 5-like [Gouania willdenowi]